MALQVVIDAPSAPQLNGTYDVDFEFTMGELHFIKKVSGVRGLEVDDAMDAGDMDVYLCLGVIGAMRAGKLRENNMLDAADLLMKEKVGAVRLQSDEPEEAVTPEASPGTNEPGETQSSSSETLPEMNTTSGSPELSGDPQETHQLATGVPI